MTKFTVNDRPVWYRMDPDTPLLWALRDASNLTGTKYGCGTGDCGACMVEVDGEAIRSCLVTIGEMEGRFVTTIEALSRDRSHPVGGRECPAMRFLPVRHDHGSSGIAEEKLQSVKSCD